jgi:hypothetical protein
MGFLRRWFAGRGTGAAEGGAADPAAARIPGQPGDEERERERELLRAEAERLDELQQRQLRYADMAWTPPAQGSERRADDEDRGRDG